MTDWRSYDAIADAYERVWGPHFEAVARHLLGLAQPAPGTRLLDLGTGTGAVLTALGGDLATLRHAVGCDLSLPMLIRARRRLPTFRLVVADGAQLPFSDGSFDLVTANCVLSHLQDFRRALLEIVRALAKPSAFAATCWGAASDPYAVAWKQLLDSALGEGAAQRAMEAVAPSESHLSSSHNLRGALLEAGFSSVRVEVVELRFDYSVQEYLADRELSSGGRFGRDVMGEAGWRQFLERSAAHVTRRFGERVRYERPLVVGIGKLT